MQRHTYKQDKNVCYVDGEEVGSFPYLTWSIDYPLFLFGRSNANRVLNDASPCRIYSCKMWNDGVLVRSFIPCYNKNTNELGEEFGYGLYDTENNQFYGNAGSGKFLGKSFLEEGETCKVFDYEQYFIDHEMMGDISTTTITGAGTESDPYTINSSEDMWWVSKYIDYYSSTNKSFQLGVDIVFNEEEFDDDGNVVPGTSQDGRVYNWKCWNCNKTNFDGKNHFISGLYSQNSIGVLSYAKTLQNLYCKNFYEVGDAWYKGGIVQIADTVDNCHLLSGHIFTKKGALGGIVNRATTAIKNCSNYARITGSYSGYQCGGISGFEGDRRECSPLIENCVNYGTIFYGNGIGTAHKFKNCVNYGDVSTSHGGGITGYVMGGLHSLVQDCKNYGSISGSGGGIVGWVRTGSCDIINCENYGLINDGSYSGQLVGWSSNKVTVLNSKCYANGGNYRLIGNISESSQLTIKNIEINISNYDGAKNIIANACQREDQFSDIKINVNSNNAESNLYLLSRAPAELINVCVSTNFKINKIQFGSVFSDGIYESIIITSPTQKWYVGSNFSGFNISWKTGEIRLNSLSSQSSFAPRLTEESLISMGYTKLTI